MGLGTAEYLAIRRAVISLADINESAVQVAVKLMPSIDKHIYPVVDIRSSETVDAWITSPVEKLDKFDGAVNMAGENTPVTLVTDFSNKKWDLEFSVNARGDFCCNNSAAKCHDRWR